MKWSKSVTMVEAHAEGEVGRVVTGGVINIPGNTMVDKLVYMNSDGDDLRRFLVFEPRGYAQMSTNLLLPPTTSDADAGMIVLQGDKAHAMSGSNAICFVTVLLETGIVKMNEPETTVVLDTASGPVIAKASCENGKCKRVQLEMPVSYVDTDNITLDVEGLGKVNMCIAFGGIFYVLVDPAEVNLRIETQFARALVDAGSRIQRAVNANFDVRHPVIKGLTGISYVMFISRADDGRLKGATILPPGRIDRSPCGTGNSARMALMFARGEASIGDEFTSLSIIDSQFNVKILRETTVGDIPAIVPQVSGRGWIHGLHQIGIDPDDPYPKGYFVSDCWGEAFDLLN